MNKISEPNSVIKYYQDYNEKLRLTRGQAYNIEFETTMHLFLMHIPKGVKVLDCCAGTGVYAFPLAKAGYKVTAGDLVQKHVDEINAQNTDKLIEEVYQDSVLDMSQFADNSFDAVLCMGALYHLMERKDREKCITECLRVLKPSGIFAFAYVNRNAIFINNIYSAENSVVNAIEMTKTGKYGVFYCMDFGEVDDLIGGFNITKITDAGVDGILYPLMQNINAMTPEEFAQYMQYHLKTCEQPSILASSIHGLWIGKK